MRKKDLFNVVRYLCIAGILIFGLVAITGTSSDDDDDGIGCVDGTLTGSYVFTAPNQIAITVEDAELPAGISLSDIGFDLDETYTYTYDNEDIDTAMDWIEGGDESGWVWERVGESTGNYTGEWEIEDKDGIKYNLVIDDDPAVFEITATKCLLD